MIHHQRKRILLYQSKRIHLIPHFPNIVILLSYCAKDTHWSTSATSTFNEDEISRKMKEGDDSKKKADFLSMPWYSSSDGLARVIFHLKPKDLGMYPMS